MIPIATGRPGLIAMRHSTSVPALSTLALTWSSSPVETPPVVRMRSWPAATRFRPSARAARSALTMPRSLTSQPSRASIAISMKRLESYNCASARGAPGDTSSLPVENTATRMRLTTSTWGKPNAASNATSCGRSRRREVTGGNILAGGAHIRAGLQARRQNHPARVVEAYILLHEHGVGALRHRRAGEYPRGVAGPDRFTRRRAGLDASGHDKGGLRLGRKIAATDGIAVDRGIGERRQRQRRRNACRENPPVRRGEPDRLDLPHRRDPRGDDADGLVDRHHRAAEGKAIVRQLRHLAPQLLRAPSASTSSTGIANRCIIAAMAGMSSRWATGSAVSTAVSAAIAAMAGSPGNSSGLPLAPRCNPNFRSGSG